MIGDEAAVQQERQTFAEGQRVRVSLWTRTSPFGHSFSSPDHGTFLRWDEDADGFACVQHRANGQTLDYLVHWRWLFSAVEETLDFSRALGAEARVTRTRAEQLRAEARAARAEAQAARGGGRRG